jgi:chemotaxis protein MotB
MARVVTVVRDRRIALTIEGHTDDVPIHTRLFRSNWELSTARASAVIAFLIEALGFDPTRLSAAGYGEFHPRVPNDTAENRARNRRVDIVIVEERP